MDKTTISFRIDQEKVEALDMLAEAVDRDRSYLLNEAVEAYLDVQQWQLAQIKESLKQADAGELIDHEKVRKMAAGWKRRR
jgi:predicted transcriptional regulator